MGDEQEKQNNVKQTKIVDTDLPETFDSWTVITGSMSKSTNEQVNAVKSNESDNKLFANEQEPSTSGIESGIESLIKDEINLPSEKNLENTDEFSDGISIIEEDSDSMGRHTPLHMLSTEDYHVNRDILYSSQRYNKSTLTNSNQSINVVDNNRSFKNSLNFKSCTFAVFFMSVFFALVAFLVNSKYPEWSDTKSISERIIDLELQNVLLRAELDSLVKQLDYFKTKDNLFVKNNIKNKKMEGKSKDKENFKDEVDNDKVKSWPGSMPDIKEEDLNKPSANSNELHEQPDVYPKKKPKIYMVGDYSDMTYPEYVLHILQFADYDIDYRNSNLFSIDRSTYRRLLDVLKCLRIDPITKKQYQKLVINYVYIRNSCCESGNSNEELEELLEDDEQLAELLKEDEVIENNKNPKPETTELEKTLKHLQLHDLRDIYMLSINREHQMAAEKVLIQKVKQHKFKYNLYKHIDKRNKIIKNTKEIKQSKENQESKEKETDTSKQNDYKIKKENSKKLKESKEKQVPKEENDISKKNIHKNKTENFKDKNIPKKDWHENLMKQREKIRKRKDNFERRKKNWYSERGQAREQARHNYT